MNIRAAVDDRANVVVLALAAAALIGGAIWAIAQAVSTAPEKSVPMAAMLPQGALLAIQSPDFGALLQDWERSPEQSAWIKSDNYEMFSRSRLFGRLADAQKQFAAAAGLAPGAAFLHEIAGTNSVFAWYDIGKLEFLYITRLPPGRAQQTRLLQSRSSFSQRQVGSSAFYVRTHGDPQQGDLRTVAFAVSGDYLLLATREDLMAHALTLIDHTSTDSLAAELWFLELGEAAPNEARPPALRMALNLDRIVKTPYFRSYWVQRNITQMKQYRAALVDLYREPTQMREERVLLPTMTGDAVGSQAQLGELVALVPPRTAVFRAEATGDVDAAVMAVDEKLVRRGVTSYTDTRLAPTANLEDQNAGSASDLETRIDVPPPVLSQEQMLALRKQFGVAVIVAVMTADSNEPDQSEAGAAAPNVWVPLHSAVVVQAANAWDEPALRSALREALGQQLTAGGLGLDWASVSGPSPYLSLGRVRPLQFAVRGNLLLLTDDRAMMDAMLARGQGRPASPVDAALVAGFNHDEATAPFARLCGLIDGVDTKVGLRGPQMGSEESANAPAFFSGNLLGLSRTFAAMKSERMVERRDGPVTRQTVTYIWQR